MNTSEYGMVNGRSCSYVKLGRYNNCSLAEMPRTPQLSNEFVNKGALSSADQASAAASAVQSAPVNSTMISSSGAPVVTPVTQVGGSPIGVEGYYDDSANYVPHYNVPNYAPINTNALTHGVPGQCGGYFDIMAAYGADAGNCTTNYIQN